MSEKKVVTMDEAKELLAQEKKARQEVAAKAFEKLCKDNNVTPHVVETRVDGNVVNINISFTAND